MPTPRSSIPPTSAPRTGKVWRYLTVPNSALAAKPTAAPIKTPAMKQGPMSSVSFEAIRLIFTGSASAVYTNLTANHESADAAADLVDQTARQLACLLIGPQASEAK